MTEDDTECTERTYFVDYHFTKFLFACLTNQNGQKENKYRYLFTKNLIHLESCYLRIYVHWFCTIFLRPYISAMAVMEFHGEVGLMPGRPDLISFIKRIPQQSLHYLAYFNSIHKLIWRMTCKSGNCHRNSNFVNIFWWLSFLRLSPYSPFIFWLL